MRTFCPAGWLRRFNQHLPRFPRNFGSEAARGAPSHVCTNQSTTCRGQVADLEAGHPLDVESTCRRIPSRTADCRLLVSLPRDKYSAWLAAIEKVIKDKGCTKGGLDTLEGQLNHAAYGIPLARHFLTRLRAARNSRLNKKARINLTSPILADLILWMELLQWANTGISMNLIVTRRPNRICWSNSCPFRLAGSLLRSDRAL